MKAKSYRCMDDHVESFWNLKCILSNDRLRAFYTGQTKPRYCDDRVCLLYSILNAKCGRNSPVCRREERNTSYKACGFALMMCKDQCNQLQKMKSLLIELRKFCFKES